MTDGAYVARIVDVPDLGIRLEPGEGAVTPVEPTQVNMLGLAVALALGAAGYRHHPEPRDPELQTLDTLLAGEAVMPWLSAEDANDAQVYIVCEPSTTGLPQCEVQYR